MADQPSIVAFDVRHGRIFIGDAEELAKVLNLEPAMNSDESNLTSASGQGSTTIADADSDRTSVREFARRFSHRKLYERIAILLYYAHRFERRSTLTSRDLSDWFGLCGFKTPVRMDKTLDYLMRQRRMVERTGPGQWMLTTAGENVALDLLESEAPSGNQ